MPKLIDIQGNSAESKFEEPDLASIKPYLECIARQFIAYGVQDDWAIGYQHYEFKIPPSLVMVHKQIGASKYCIPIELATLNMDQLKPHTYRLDDGVLQPLEYELLPTLQHPRATPPADFLLVLAEMLQEIPQGYMLTLCPRESQVTALLSITPEDCGGAGGFCVRPFDPFAVTLPGSFCIESQWNFDYIGDIPMPNLGTVINEHQSLLEDVVQEGLLGGDWRIKIHVQQKCWVVPE